MDQRRSLRLKEYDYTQPGAYFITIVTQDRTQLFGEIVDGEMHLNDAGRVVQSLWDEIPTHFPNSDMGTFVVMPNHVHGIIIINNATTVGATHASPLHDHGSPLRNDKPKGPEPQSIGAIIGSFKSAVTNRINKMRNAPGARLWQRNYYEHVIRDDNDYESIVDYILANSFNWEKDAENICNGPQKLVTPLR